MSMKSLVMILVAVCTAGAARANNEFGFLGAASAAGPDPYGKLSVSGLFAMHIPIGDNAFVFGPQPYLAFSKETTPTTPFASYRFSNEWGFNAWFGFGPDHFIVCAIAGISWQDNGMYIPALRSQGIDGTIAYGNVGGGVLYTINNGPLLLAAYTVRRGVEVGIGIRP